MRQAKKEILDKEIIISLLNTAVVGRLGTNGHDGYPMIKPLNFVYDQNKIYFHSARAGEKIEDIKRDNRVCFEVDLAIAHVKSCESPCRSHYLYRSVIIKGRASLVSSASERMQGLKLLMEKYQPEGGYGDFPQEKVDITEVVRIDIEEMVGKEDLGKEEALRSAAIQALRDGTPLPIVLIRE